MELEEAIKQITEQVYNRITKPENRILLLSEAPDSEIQALLPEHSLICPQDSVHVTDFNTVLSPFLCLSGLVNLSNGRSDGAYQQIFLEAILKGKEVIQLVEGVQYMQYKNTAPPKLLELYASCVAKLKTYGVHFFTKRELPGFFERKQNPQFVKTSKKLITHRIIEDLIEKGQNDLNISCSSIITPYAADLIKEYNINVIKLPEKD